MSKVEKDKKIALVKIDDTEYDYYLVPEEAQEHEIKNLICFMWDEDIAKYIVEQARFGKSIKIN